MEILTASQHGATGRAARIRGERIRQPISPTQVQHLDRTANPEGQCDSKLRTYVKENLEVAHRSEKECRANATLFLKGGGLSFINEPVEDAYARDDVDYDATQGDQNVRLAWAIWQIMRKSYAWFFNSYGAADALRQYVKEIDPASTSRPEHDTRKLACAAAVNPRTARRDRINVGAMVHLYSCVRDDRVDKEWRPTGACALWSHPASNVSAQRFIPCFSTSETQYAAIG